MSIALFGSLVAENEFQIGTWQVTQVRACQAARPPAVDYKYVKVKL